MREFVDALVNLRKITQKYKEIKKCGVKSLLTKKLFCEQIKRIFIRMQILREGLECSVPEALFSFMNRIIFL